MADNSDLYERLDRTLDAYGKSFRDKIYAEENEDHDLLMNVFGITPELKRENRQYWGRELGMCWQVLVTQICKATRGDFRPAIRIGSDEPADLVIAKTAIDTKYRLGSGDSGTLKKFKQYGPLLKEMELEPVLLLLREDNLGAAINACVVGGWKVLTGDRTLDFLKMETGVDVRDYLEQRKDRFAISADR